MPLVPKRSPDPGFSHYRNYRPVLREDGNYGCVYCSLLEGENGGDSNYHVEHWKPRARFRAETHSYPNLFYACAHCNLKKGNSWYEGDVFTQGRGYPDPKTTDYATLLPVAANGLVTSKETVGLFLIERLHLNSPFLRGIRLGRLATASAFESLQQARDELEAIEKSPLTATEKGFTANIRKALDGWESTLSQLSDAAPSMPRIMASPISAKPG